MVGLNKMGTTITVIISLTLATLFLEILYLLWRLHSLRRRTHSDPGTHKKLLHFLCWKRKSHLEPQRTSPPTSLSSDLVYKSGSFGRSSDITKFSSYRELRRDLARMFGVEGELEDPVRSDWQLVFVDREKNDVLLLGDGPWP